MSGTVMWATAILGSLLVLALKVLGHLVPAHLVERPAVARLAGMLTVALLAALVAVQGATSGRSLALDSRLPALVVAAVAVRLRAPFLLVVVLAAATAALLRAAGLP